MMTSAAAAIAATVLLSLSTAAVQAAKIEKVDMVREGIDLRPVEVHANSNGYVGMRTKSHDYMVRVFAKGKGGNHIYWAALSSYKNSNPFTKTATYFSQKAPAGSDGWGVYKKSLSVSAGTANTTWATHPKKACDDNLKEQVAKGAKRSDVLRRDWKVTAHAVLYFNVAVDSKSRIKKRNTSKSSSEYGSTNIYYPVTILCEAAL